jgi:hypothetical protein
VHVNFLSGKLKGRLRTPRHRWNNNIEMCLKYGMRVWTGCIWHRKWTSGGIM